jgi:hypothetical protein
VGEGPTFVRLDEVGVTEAAMQDTVVVVDVTSANVLVTLLVLSSP